MLATTGLDFESPVGKVRGLKGQVVFTSLTPLITAADQVLTVDQLDTITPLTDLELRFALDENALNLAGGRIDAAGGRTQAVATFRQTGTQRMKTKAAREEDKRDPGGSAADWARWFSDPRNRIG